VIAAWSVRTEEKRLEGESLDRRMNYYILLGISQDADANTIRSAFRTLARRYHPDAGEGSSTDRFREILTAYETLNDPRRRWHYDRALQERRVRIRRVEEPLRAQAAPEPLFSPQRAATRRTFADRSLAPRHLDELLDELFQAWDEMFFGAPRRPDRT
jgi:curved DNA-binding protein CbpA